MDPKTLAQAIAATFKRRGTTVPVELPTGLTPEFSGDAGKQRQWQAFVAKNRLDAPSLSEVVAELAVFSHTALTRAASIRGPA